MCVCGERRADSGQTLLTHSNVKLEYVDILFSANANQ